MKLIAAVQKCVPTVVADVLAKGRATHSALLLASLTMLSLGAVGCAKAKFDKQDFNATAQAGQYTKPKIDIVVFQDYSSSMVTPMNSIKSQFSGFVNNLNANWDYHFTVLPLQGAYPLTSKYILAQDCSSVNSAYCLNNSQKDYFNNAAGNAGWINSFNAAVGSTDLAFKNMTTNLSDPSMTSTKFLRADAALAVIIISNGEDLTALDSSNNYVAASSLPNFYVDLNGDGRMDINYALPAYAQAATKFQNFMSNFKSSTSPKRVFSVVAANNYGNCYGSSAWQGLRYMDLAVASNGYWYDFCDSSSLNNVLSSISYDMNSLMEAYQFNYVVMDAAPVVGSIKLYKNGVLIPQGGANGWSDAGQLTNQPISFYPTLSNYRSGYMLKLSGSAIYKGTDVITISYQKM